MATTTEANVHCRARVSVAHDRATPGAAILLRLAAAYLGCPRLHRPAATGRR